MRLLLASSEVHPFSKTGGLADMVAALGKALGAKGHHVGLVTPLYAGVHERFPALRKMDIPLDVALGGERLSGEVWCLESGSGLSIYFIDQPEFYQRAGLYQQYGTDYPDNAERFIFFSKAVAHLALHLPWKPELLQLNDWQVALAALLLHHQRQLPGWHDVPRTCMTIHNLAYQGVFPAAKYTLTNLPWDYFTPDAAEFYNQFNLLKCGIAFADIVTTVSPRYAREITTEEFGCGLDGLLRNRRQSLFGILNGVDYDEWNPVADRYLNRSYSSGDLRGKEALKLELQKEFGLLPDGSIPLFGNIGRLVEQKGVDILLGALEEMLSADLQLVLLGSGAPVYQRAFLDLARRYPARAAVRIGFDEGFSHLVEAGSDFFIMPSRFEPCGLNQMYSLRYGTIPLVRATGGLDDTVRDIREDAKHANGIKFSEYSAGALAKAMRKALALYQEPELFRAFRLNGMGADFSWDRTALRYVELFHRTLKP